MLDYHLHLWTEEQQDMRLAIDQLQAYWERASAAGVVEIALTEHLFRFAQADHLLAAVSSDPGVPDRLRVSMAHYWRLQPAVDLDRYVELVLEAQRAGLPIALGLEVDYYQGRMSEVSALLSGYPFDVLLGSVHWFGGWRFDDLSDPVSMGEWDVRDVDACWSAYTGALEELAASRVCDVLAHCDVIKVAGVRPGDPRAWWDRIVQAAKGSGMAVEVSSAGWRKPAAEQYPAGMLLTRLVANGVPLTTASDAHTLAHVADRVEDLRAVLLGAGVRTLTAYRRRQPHTVPITSREPAGSNRPPIG